MRRITLIVIQILMVVSLRASDPKAICLQAQDAYSKEDFSAAIELYTSMVKEGYVSSALFYNLASVHYMAGHLAEARLYYERALRLEPHDALILKNLASLKSSLPDQFAEVLPFAPLAWWKWVAGYFSPNAWAVMVLILVWIICALLWCRWKRKWPLKPKYWWVSVVMAGCFLVVTSALGISRQKLLLDHSEAIVMTSEVSLKSAPDAYGKELIMLHAGTKVSIQDRIGDKVKVELLNGDAGWLPADSIESI